MRRRRWDRVRTWVGTAVVVIAVALGIVSASDAVAGGPTQHPVVRT